MSVLMGIDLGTSSVKTMIIDQMGKPLGYAQEAYDILVPHIDYAEQNPEKWWQSVCQTIKKSLAHSPLLSADIASIGLSGQMHGLVLLDKNGVLLRPAIIWCDQRTKEIKKRLERTYSREKIGRLVQNPISTGFLLLSLIWVKENEPEIYDQIWKVMLPKDYIRFRLTGEIGVDSTDAAATLGYDVCQKQWSKPFLQELGIDLGMLPEISEPWEIAGEVTMEAAVQTGLQPKTSVVYGGGDQPMQALGNGVINPETCSVTIGTGGQLFSPIAEPNYDPLLRIHTFTHAVPQRWYLLGATLSAGLSLKWLATILGSSSYSELDQLASTTPVGSDHLYFLPYLAGERTPHMDSYAKGMFIGLTLKHGKEHMIRSVMEGVAYSFRDGLHIFKAMGVTYQRIIASGGGAQSIFWTQIIADTLQSEVYISENKEAACLGAAMMAGVGLGLYRDIREACDQVVRISSRPVVPNGSHADVYTSKYEVYREIYQRNQDLFLKL